jgi:FkbM family methyltransferase
MLNANTVVRDQRFLATKNAILYALALPARRRNFLSTRIANICRHYLRVYENCNWHFAENGEMEVLKRLSSVPMNVVFDVGAHEGTWSEMALRYFPDATIHAFEIAPPTAEALQSRFQTSGRIVVNAVGLGENAKAVDIAYFPDHRDNTLILPTGQIMPADAKQLTSEVEAGDKYCEDRGINRIGFCKIDVEGHEYFVLRGFRRLLSRRAIDIIQFEHICASNWRRLHCLEDIFTLLFSCGYQVGRIFPDGVLAQPYDTSLECLNSANYIAISDQRPDLRELLKYR